MKNIKTIPVALAIFGTSLVSLAQDQDPKLHVNPRWKECSFQLDPSLTPQAWHEFATEVGLITYFRPLTDAKPMGTGHFEVSVLQWQTKFDDSKAAWNDTFVHPDLVHWLKEGERLPFPVLTARVGITDKLDAGIFWTKAFGANYGFFGGQLQYNLLNNSDTNWAAAARMSYTSMYGPEDLRLNAYGVDVLVSKEFPIFSDWAFVSPYAGVSSYVSNSGEKTEKVNLNNEHVVGGQAMMGAVLKLSVARIGVEYNLAKVNTVSFKIGVAF